MKRAGFEVRKIINLSCKSNDLIDCEVMIDGSWQSKGFTSLNGVITATWRDKSKVIDAVVLSKFCKGCQIWERKKGTIAYEQWKCTHNYQINHNGSSGSMEAVGAIEIFGSSITKYSLHYSKYLGDRNTASFTKVVDSQP